MIDAHVHLWNLQVRDQSWIPLSSPIRRTFALGDLRTAIAPTPVNRVVLVQVINDASETADLLKVADDRLVAGVVGWADVSGPAFPDDVARLRASGPLVGIRHQALAEPDPAAWLGSSPVQRALHELERMGLPFDLILRPEHLSAAAATARAHPSLRLVLDHLGKPSIAQRELEPWAGGLLLLAAERNVSCKLSGLQTMAAEGWAYDDLSPVIEVALAAFGPERLIFGSDWPVSTSAASYDQVCRVAIQACDALSDTERELVLGGAARDVYGLP